MRQSLAAFASPDAASIPLHAIAAETLGDWLDSQPERVRTWLDAVGFKAAVGETVRLQDESQMDAVTAVSGSGPAYVFHLIEALTAAGVAQGLPTDMAMRLARATVCGAGELAHQSAESAAQLRINVTSPGGTTAAALAVLMNETDGFPPLLARAVQAAADRSRELGQ